MGMQGGPCFGRVSELVWPTRGNRLLQSYRKEESEIIMNSNKTAKAKLTASIKMLHGKDSWAYFYVALGFVSAIEGAIIQMITPIVFPWNIIMCVALGVVTFSLFICSPWFQDRLIGLKNRYENTPR
jgi:hypothetical protein